jgi:hypothetical protein
MNANDLADRLEQFYTGTHIQKAAEVLRQQQAQIEALKAHPAKTLTDEELEILIMDISDPPSYEDLYDFARAILRKAGEK